MGGTVIGLIVSAVFIVLILRGIDWRLLGSSIRQAAIGPLVVAMLGFAAANLLIALRWKALLANDRLRFLPLFEILTIGLVCNVVLPARGGDMVRVVVLSQRERVRKSVGLATILLEKLFDVAALVALLIPALLWVDLPRWVLASLSLAVAGVLAGFALCLLLARSARDVGMLPLVRLLPVSLRVRIDSVIAAVRDGLRLLFSRRRLGTVCLLSLLIWIVNSLAAYLVIAGLQIGGVTPLAMFVVIAIMNLGLVIPSSPGYVGTYEFLGIAALALFGVAREPALEFALVLHALTLLVVLVLGTASMARRGYSLAMAARSASMGGW